MVMSQTGPRRWPVSVVLLGVAALVVAAALAVVADKQAEPVRIEGVFEEPDSFCEAWALDSFTNRVRTVQRAVSERRAASAATTVTVGLLRRLAGLDDAPAALRHRVRALAHLLEVSEPPDFERARATATQLDGLTLTTCG